MTQSPPPSPPSPQTPSYSLQQKVFLWLLVVVTIAFGWILLPYSGAIFWGVVLAILFAPLHNRMLAATGRKANVASLLTLLTIVVIVILPVSLVTMSLVNQALGIYKQVGTGHIDVGRYFSQVVGALPQWAVSLLDRYDLSRCLPAQMRLIEEVAALRG